MQVCRRIVDQPLQRLVDIAVGEGVQVIQHQHQLASVTGDTAHQGEHGALDRLAVDPASFQLHRLMDHGGVDLGNAGQQIVEEARQLIVLGGQGQPGEVEAEGQQRLPPGMQGGGLAAAGRAAHHEAAPMARLQQSAEQSVAGDDVLRASWRQQLAVVDRVFQPADRQGDVPQGASFLRGIHGLSGVLRGCDVSGQCIRCFPAADAFNPLRGKTLHRRD
ncbi:hypothetical protein D3C78_579420 [compost metagenome]